MSSFTTTPTSTPIPSPSSQSPGGGGGGGGGGGNPANSPLLFFVALGFGVVFTNLWIIVGVKYCFRYNQRNRQLRNEENGDPIDLLNVQRPHRRRREKKLMTIEDVNERFPLTKYKAWRASRADEGLPTTGGVQAPAGSRPQSLKEEAGVVTVPPTAPVTTSSPVDPATSAAKEDPRDAPIPTTQKGEEQSGAQPATAQQSSSESTDTVTPADGQQHLVEYYDKDDDDDHIQTALPAELLTTPGDSCAICLDVIEDDDDVRGLTCGHAFHASCVDPWLTSRRACCPLCKYDYYVPKPRPEGAEGNHERSSRHHRGPAEPPAAHVAGSRGGPFTSRMVLPGRFIPIGPPAHERHRSQRQTRERRSQPLSSPGNSGTANASQATSSWRARLPSLPVPRMALPAFRRPGWRQQHNDNTTTEAASGPTPSQLESATR